MLIREKQNDQSFRFSIHRLSTRNFFLFNINMTDYILVINQNVWFIIKSYSLSRDL